ncbi:unnamed protein product [Gongylonema pulchrum]|uniref:S-adenosyl-L-methionine-dependent methyltransferases superfamily protein n=1 Tax=Gongylonema pulchrum TaxID=637853 RepID=A0A183EX12_9BILA|nr:unnamed protein product [Gongylonema pulchrum]
MGLSDVPDVKIDPDGVFKASVLTGSRSVSNLYASLAKIFQLLCDQSIGWLTLQLYLQVTEKGSKNEKVIVRGFRRCAYHGDILDETETELGADYELKCLGGGRIKHEPKNRSILVYGYSQVGVSFAVCNA